MEKQKVVIAFIRALAKVDIKNCEIYNDNERQWGLTFYLGGMLYRGVVYKYKRVEEERKGWKRLFSKYKTSEVEAPYLDIRISNDFYFSAISEDQELIESFREFFTDVVAFRKKEMLRKNIEREEQRVETLNNLVNY